VLYSLFMYSLLFMGNLKVVASAHQQCIVCPVFRYLCMIFETLGLDMNFLNRWLFADGEVNFT
jgi:hypothetical protein